MQAQGGELLLLHSVLLFSSLLAGNVTLPSKVCSCLLSLCAVEGPDGKIVLLLGPVSVCVSVAILSMSVVTLYIYFVMNIFIIIIIIIITASAYAMVCLGQELHLPCRCCTF